MLIGHNLLRMAPMRRIIGLVLIAGALIAGLYWILTVRATPSLPFKRVVLVTIDTLRADHLQSYGYFRSASPFIDGLAANGVRFSNVVSSSSHTGPSHASLFTSLYPFQHRLLRNGETLDPRLFHIRDIFEGLGFIVKAFPAVRFMNGQVGFDAEDKERFSELLGRSPLIRAKANVDRVISWIEAEAGVKKFFVWLHLYDVHQWQFTRQLPPAELAIMQQTSTDELAEFAYKKRSVPEGLFKREEKLRNTFDGCDSELLYVDGQLKRLHDYFQSKGMGEDTLWIITSDHGEGLGNHRYFGHGQHIYQEQLKVPLIMFSPEKLRPAVVDSMIASIDLLPSLAELFSVSLNNRVIGQQGSSFASLLYPETSLADERALKAERYVLSERRPKDGTRLRNRWRNGEVYSIQNQTHKLISYSNGPDELYELSADPWELKNVLGEQAAQAQALEAKLNLILEESIRPTVGPVDSEVDPKTIQDLKTLGYM